MNVPVRVSHGVDEQSRGSVVHSLPCKIGFDGRVAVGLYFRPRNTEQMSDVHSEKNVVRVESQLRGRRLVGNLYKLENSELSGVVLKASAEQVVVETTFNSIYIWGHDIPPAKNDNVRKSLAWSKISTALHSPIE